MRTTAGLLTLWILLLNGCAPQGSEQIDLLDGDQAPRLERGCYTVALSGAWLQCNGTDHVVGLRQQADPARHVFVDQILCCPAATVGGSEEEEEAPQ